MEVPQAQFLDRVLDAPVVTQRHVQLPSMPQEQIQERIVEETDIPVPHVMEKTIEVAKHIAQERTSDCVVEQTVDIPVQQKLEQTVEVVRTNCGRISSAADFSRDVQMQVQAVQVAQKTVKDPQTQSTSKVMRIPVAPSMNTVVDVPVVAQHQEPTVHSANKKGRWSQTQIDHAVQEAERCKD